MKPDQPTPQTTAPIVTRSGNYTLISITTFPDRAPEAIFQRSNDRGRSYDDVLPDEITIRGVPVEKIYEAWNPNFSGIAQGKPLAAKKFNVTLTIGPEAQ